MFTEVCCLVWRFSDGACRSRRHSCRHSHAVMCVPHQPGVHVQQVTDALRVTFYSCLWFSSVFSTNCCVVVPLQTVRALSSHHGDHRGSLCGSSLQQPASCNHGTALQLQVETPSCGRDSERSRRRYLTTTQSLTTTERTEVQQLSLKPRHTQLRAFRWRDSSSGRHAGHVGSWSLLSAFLNAWLIWKF